MQAWQRVALTLEGAQLERPHWSYQAVRWEMNSRCNGAGNQHRCGHGQRGQQGQAPVEAACPAVLLGCEVVPTLGKSSGHVDHILEEVCLTKGPGLHAWLNIQACRAALMRFSGVWGLSA